MQRAVVAAVPFMILVAALPAAAQDEATLAASDALTLVARIGPDHADFGKALTAISAKIGYIDADADNRVDATNPDEPVYLDVAGDGRLSYGDLRLTRFVDYAPGTSVDLGNRDFGLTLSTPAGWFALRGDAVSTIDADFSGSLTLGDVRLDGTKPAAGDSDLGAPTPIAQPSTTGRVGFVDGNGNGARDVGELVVLDMDDQSTAGGRRVSEGDVAFVFGAFPRDDAVTHAELAAAQAQTSEEAVTAKERVSGFDWLLVALAVLNLAGLAYVMREVNKQRPKNPFR